MKLRILGNKLRFRLTQTEVSMLEQGTIVTEQTEFDDSKAFGYQLLVDEVTAISTSFQNNIISVSIPRQLVSGWAQDERVGLYSDNGNVAIEKDYQCLHKRPGEDEIDNYRNPAVID